jgi:simple sugar transport system permease protein
MVSVYLPVLTYMVVGALCGFIHWFMNTKLGQDMRTVGQDRAVATSSGINVNRIRIIAMILSTVLASYGQLISLQNIGTVATYGSHQTVGLYAIAALLVGGASVQQANIKQALLGIVLFHTLFILSPNAGKNLLGNAQIGEYFRVFVAYGVIMVALAMHAWARMKRRPSL